MGFKKLVKRYHRWKEAKRFKEAKSKADYMNQLSGKKHFVLKLSGDYYVVNREEIKAGKKLGAFAKNLGCVEIEQRALYIAVKRSSITNQ